MKSLIGKMDELSKDKIDEAAIVERKDPDRFRKLKAEYERLSGKKAPAGTSTTAMQISVDRLKREKETKKVEEAKKGLPPWLKDKKDGEEIVKDKAKDRAKDVEAEMKKGSKDDLDEDYDPKKKKEADDASKTAKEIASRKEDVKGKYSNKNVSKKWEKTSDNLKKSSVTGLDESIAIQADGDEAMALLLKLSGQQPMEPQDATMPIGMTVSVPSPADVPDDSMDMQDDSQEFTVDEADRDPTYSNTPDEETCGMDAAIPSGDDLNRPKTMTKHGYQQGDNPLAMEDIKSMEGKLAKMFESMSKKG